MRGTPLAALLASLALAPVVGAESTCQGLAACCPTTLPETLSRRAVVSLGVAVVGLYNVNERAGTWDADYYLYEAWTPQPDFTPRTEVVNEVDRHSEQFDTVIMVEGRCVRTRRIRSTLHTQLDLRLFPFDRQRLALQFSDAWWDSEAAGYADTGSVLGVDVAVREQLSQWRVDGDLRYSHAPRVFGWESGLWGGPAPSYDYAEFTLAVRRHTTYHLTKFFLPLLVIVALSLSVFWVDPEDLASQVGIGITCLLAAIAFQLAQATTLPEVAYLTLADRIYVVCYLAIAGAMVESLYSNVLARRGRRERALAVDRACRWAVPVLLAVAIALCAWTAR